MIWPETAFTAMMAVLICAGCGRIPARPERVPVSAVFVPAAKGGYWHDCRLDASGQCTCTIYLRDGRVVYDELFLPYEGSPPTAPQLIISTEGTGDTVKLANGQLLLPKSEYEMRKRYWDWRLGKAATP
ncbi:MAG: hypothetical protein LC130_14080 [Bryobacterales bacterium]|nr:hypothetical protein [Bryobacterales bacterium]